MTGPPLSHEGRIARHSRSGVVASVAGLTIFAGCVRAASFFVAGDVPLGLMFLGAAGVAAWVLLWVRAQPDSTLPAHLLIGTLVVAVSLTSHQRGGIGSSTTLALGIVPVLATLLAGIRAGWVWCLAVAAVVVTMAAADLAGLPTPDHLPESTRWPIDFVASLLLPVVSCGIGMAHERARAVTEASVIRAERLHADAREEAQLLRVERHVGVGRLASATAHQVNNPLAYAASNVAYTIRRLAEPPDDIDFEELRRALLDGEDGLRRVASIVADLQTFVRSAESPLKPLDLRQVVASAVAGASDPHDRIEVVLPDEPVLAKGDAGQLSQAFGNLINNGLEALGEDGDGVIRVSAFASEDGSVQVEIADTGVGMSSEVRARAPAPFFTTKSVGQGPGLGLSVAENLVAAHGGSLTLESTPGAGTTARITLPAARGSGGA